MGRVAVKGRASHLVQGIVAVRPHLGQVERVQAIGPGFLEGHDCTRSVQLGNSPFFSIHIERIAPVIVGVLTGQPVGVLLGKKFDALVGLDFIPTQNLSPVSVDHMRVLLESPFIWRHDFGMPRSPWEWRPGGPIRATGSRSPIACVIAQVGVGPTLLGADEALKLQRITEEEHRGVIPDHVVLSLGHLKLNANPRGPRQVSRLPARHDGRKRIACWSWSRAGRPPPSSTD